MPGTYAPEVDFDQSEFQWTYWRVGCQEQDLFGELSERFNKMPTPTFIQDPEAFHRDVAEIALQARDKGDFFARMEERKEKRLNELLDFRKELWHLLHRSSSMNTYQLFHFTRFYNFASLDTILALCASLLPRNQHGKDPSLAAARQEFDDLCRFAKEHPGETAAAVLLTIVALGVLAELLPIVIELLGLAELGAVEGQEVDCIDTLRWRRGCFGTFAGDTANNVSDEQHDDTTSKVKGTLLGGVSLELHKMRLLLRRGVPHRVPAYPSNDHGTPIKP
ncbi:myb-like DNA-binding domain-containing protein [Purpureocillium lavendulum]|uniref:Myb-like DNA-binding domain-containing protein n=1 Tax=Purpureocillium lavendulum TaxID=1247861 RepID=A0AB34FGE0_9HYPO|nr:myb-like DNA-binding domain-containing protein [Purpureocillium lavendulum]